ncbi:MAG: hypothetical protein PUB29_08385 [Bacteroidales bacterium]|nr:hypothetical protein [Bacteroidales bacterium]MDD6185625.1 hypothetical protein [Bacteroidales bacterium]
MSDNKQRIPLKLPSLAFVVCLLISIACWVLVTFSKDYKMTYEYKLVCDNLPEGRKSVTASDTIIELTFNQKGLRYLAKPFTDKEKVVVVSVNDLIKPKHKVSVYTFTNKEMCDFLSTHNFGPELVAVSSPEVLTFYLR